MAIEHASTHVVRKPWGRTDLLPWHSEPSAGEPVGEVWFERAGSGLLAYADAPSLLLKLLYTSQPLSIQVHPDDAFARSLGQPRGKSEAWVVLAAEPGAQVAVGLKQRVSGAQLRSAIRSGAIADLVAWRPVLQGDVIPVPAGTIHAIGAGLVLAEIQQRSDTTFRLFDFGRGRALHADYAVAVATPGPAADQPAPRRMTDERMLLGTTPFFVLERIDLGPGMVRDLRVDAEAWLLVLAGHVRLGRIDAIVGEAIVVMADRAQCIAGPAGFSGLLAYAAPAWQPDILSAPGDNSVGITPKAAQPAPEGALQ